MDVALYAIRDEGLTEHQPSRVTVLPVPCAEAILLCMEGKKEGKGTLILFLEDIRTPFHHVCNLQQCHRIKRSESTSTSRLANISIENSLGCNPFQ